MRLLLTLLCSKIDCSNFHCDSFMMHTRACLEIIEPNQPPFYEQMSRCAAAEFKCHVEHNPDMKGGQVKVSFVSMTKCIRTTPVMISRRNKREISNFINEPNDRWQHEEQCPTRCPEAKAMVCARYGEFYRSFMSACYMRMYQCRHPTDKLELVARRSCYAAAPIIAGQANQSVHVDNRNDKFFRTPRRLVHKGKTPKPTVDLPWLTRHRKTTRRNKVTQTTRSPKQKTKQPKKTTIPHKLKSPTSSSKATTSLPDDSDCDHPDESFKKHNVHFTVSDQDICEDDEYEETPIDVPDVCPVELSSIDNILDTERNYVKIEIHPDQVEDIPPVWTVWNHGTAVTIRARADAGIVVGCEVYAGLDFSGRVIVNTLKDADFIGFVFGYRSNRLFYLVTWKAKAAKYWIGTPFVAKADAGLHIKLVNSSTGPGPLLRNSIYNTESSEEQVTLLWQDPAKQGWKHKRRYTWRLIHRPHIGLIRMKVFMRNNLLVDTGNIFDHSIPGGRLGLFSFSQEEIEWTQMESKCNDKIPSNLMSELPADLQEKSVVDSQLVF